MTSLISLLRVLQVRTLIYDYLMDENQGLVSGRNPISSINEILRDGKLTRDRGKVRLEQLWLSLA